MFVGEPEDNQKGDVWGFWGSTTNAGKTIEGSYVDGLSITHINQARHHIWTYAVGHFDGVGVSYGCPCSPYKANQPPSYINKNYYCESGATKDPTAGSIYYLSDPLWDGSGCSKNNTCCSNKQQPWFYRNLGVSTTNDIEARICISYGKYEAGAVVVDQLELYIQ